jgi:hypothetical protein
LRKVAVALAAIPVLAVLYAPLVIRRGVAARLALVCGAGAIIVTGVAAAAIPRNTVATQRPLAAPVPAAEFRPILVAHGLVNPIIVDFSQAMDQASVETALTVSPEVPISIRWSSDSTSLAVAPETAWLPSTFHTLTIGPTARDATGTIVERALRSVFLTRQGVGGVMLASDRSGQRIQLDSRFVIAFDGPVDVATAVRAFRSEPAVRGTWTQPAPYDGTRLLFTPLEPLAAGTSYSFSFDSDIRDLEGAPLGVRPLLGFKTEVTPSVVRFRPRPGWTDVERSQVLSVRFTRPMERLTTAAAFSVTVDGKEIRGSVSWAERDTVLVFNPRELLPYGARVTMRVDASARAVTGAPIEEPGRATFTVEKRPVRRVATTTTAIPTGGGSGGSTGSATWLVVEKYYFRLLTCTRGGGLVTSSGACSSPGGSGLPVLKLDSGISSRVARPYARRLAVAGACDHWYAGTSPSSRLKAAGYTNYTWGENLGCRSGNPYSAVLGSHLFFQSERSYNGGHWRNIMNPDYDRVGVGVWVSGGRVRLVTDFYHP